MRSRLTRHGLKHGLKGRVVVRQTRKKRSTLNVAKCSTEKVGEEEGKVLICITIQIHFSCQHDNLRFLFDSLGNVKMALSWSGVHFNQ